MYISTKSTYRPTSSWFPHGSCGIFRGLFGANRGSVRDLSEKKMGPLKRPQDDIITDPKLQQISTNLSFIWANIVLRRFGDVQHHLFVEFLCFKSLTISYTLSNGDGKGKHAIYTYTYMHSDERDTKEMNLQHGHFSIEILLY